MSFGQADPRVYLLNIETGQREVVGNFPGMTFSPRFSPDGRRIIMSMEQNGSANINAMDLQSRAVTTLTADASIDTALRAGDPGPLRDLDAAAGVELWAYDVPALQALGSTVDDVVEASVTYADDAYGVQYWVARWTCES